MIWTLLVASALAADSEEALTESLLALREQARDTVLVAASGPDAERTVLRLLKPAGADGFAVVRIPTAGDLDREASAVLAASKLRCGVRVTMGVDSFWTADPFGDCAPLAAAPTLAQADAGPAAPGTQGVVGPAPVSAVDDRRWDKLDQEYNQRRLEVVDVSPRDGLPEGVRWQVVDGLGAALPTRRLADVAGDDELTFRLDEEQRQSFRRQRILTWSGVALLATAIVPLVGLESGAPANNQDRLFTSLFLAAGGGVTIAVAPLTRKGTAERQEYPAWYYRAADAEDLVVDHNRHLYRELGLNERPMPETVALPPEAAPAPDGASAPGDATGAEAGSPPTRVILGGAAPAPVPEGPPARVVLPAEPEPETAPAADPEPAPARVVLPAPPEGEAPAPPAPDAAPAPAGDDAAGRSPSAP